MDYTTLDLVRIIDINLFSMLILIVLFISVIRNIEDRHEVSTRLFALLILAAFLMAVLDIAGWIWEDRPGSGARLANIIANTLLYICNPLPAAIWLLYVQFQLFSSRRRLLHLIRWPLAVLAVNGIMTVVSLWTGWFFSVNAANHYERGPLFFLHVLFPYGLLLASIAMVLLFRSLQGPEMHRALLLFVVPPLFGTVLQVLFYGLSLNWASITLSILIVFLLIQNRGLSTDSLTGTYNRRHFERIIAGKILRADRERFSVIIADLDSFKQINDRFGHDVGDEALLQTVQLFRRTLRQDDLIARFGGDEFYILLDIADDAILQTKVSRIAAVFTQYSQEAGLSYQLSVSMGAAVYDPDSGLTAEPFLRQVDQLMYQAKNRRQQDAAGA